MPTCQPASPGGHDVPRSGPWGPGSGRAELGAHGAENQGEAVAAFAAAVELRLRADGLDDMVPVVR